MENLITYPLRLNDWQIADLESAFGRHGWKKSEVDKLTANGLLASVLQVVRGQASINLKRPPVDLRSDPYLPKDWSLISHRRANLWEFNPKKISLYLSGPQKNGIIAVNELREDLLQRKVFNANLLDYLLLYPELIPESWKGLELIFWGTIYQAPGGSLCVRYLRWWGDRWAWNYHWLSGSFIYTSPALIQL